MAKCFARIGLTDLSMTEKICADQGVHLDHQKLMTTLATERTASCRDRRAAFEISYRRLGPKCETATDEMEKDAAIARAAARDAASAREDAAKLREKEREDGRSLWAFLFAQPTVQDYEDRAARHDADLQKVLSKYGADSRDVSANVTCMP